MSEQITPAVAGRKKRNMLIIEAYNRMKDDPDITNIPKAVAPEVEVSEATVRRVLQANGLLDTVNHMEAV